jgi:hypothetical protein
VAAQAVLASLVHEKFAGQGSHLIFFPSENVPGGHSSMYGKPFCGHCLPTGQSVQAIDPSTEY